MHVLTETGVTADGKVVLSAEKTKFVSGYFERSGRHEQNINLILFTIVPLVAVGIVLSVVSAALGQGAAAALGAFAAVIAFGVPLTQIVGAAWAEFGMSLSLRSVDATVIGNSVEDEYSDAGVVIFDDDFAFPEGTASVREMRIYDNEEIYKTLYSIGALYSAVGGPLAKTFRNASSELGEPESVELREYGTDFVSATVDSHFEICAGSAEAFELRGIELYAKKKKLDSGKVAIYFALNGVPCAEMVCKYDFGSDFKYATAALTKEKLEIRIRSLDPAVNEALTDVISPEGATVLVSKEAPHREVAECLDAGIASRSGERGLIKPLTLRRKTRSVMKMWSNARNIAMVACTLFGAILALCGMSVGLSALAALCQTVCFGLAMVAFWLIGKQNDNIN